MSRKPKAVPLAVRILRAVSDFGSDDATRPNLAGCTVLSAHRVAATDGHRLIVIDSDDAHGLPVGQIVNVKDAIKRIEVGAPVEATTNAFPNVDNVIPALGRVDRGESLDTMALGVNPVYMAEAFAALAKIAEVVRVTYARDDLSPLRIDGRGEGLRAVVVIMPVRVREHDRKQQDPWFSDDPAKCTA